MELGDSLMLKKMLPLVCEASASNIIITVELQWLEHLWNHENMFETGVVRANEC